MAGWHHRINGHEFEQALGDSEGQGSLAWGSSWSHKESGKTQSLNSNRDKLIKTHTRTKELEMSESMNIATQKILS